VALAVASATPGATQTVTNITPDVAAGISTGTTAVKSGSVTTIGGGTLAGGNLFHSFQFFNLASGETARWSASNPAAVLNVVNRVTGGVPSNINGMLDSNTLPNAAFFFINPAGVVLGSNAKISVPNAVYLSTAAELRFADGEKFSATAPGGSTFTISSPASFGFLGGQGAISLNGLQPTALTTHVDVNLSASTITIANTTINPGAINLFSVGADMLDLPLSQSAPANAVFGGNLLLSTSQINTDSAFANGAVSVSAGTFTMSGGAIETLATATRPAGDINLHVGTAVVSGAIHSLTGFGTDAGNINISGTNIGFPTGGSITSTTSAAGRAGNITVQVTGLPGAPGRLQLNPGTQIATRTLQNSSGSAGNVFLTADIIRVLGSASGSAQVSSSTQGSGTGGNITINAGNSLTLGQNSLISVSANAFSSQTHAGALKVNTGALNIQGGSLLASSSSNSDAGEINVTAGTVTIANSGSIKSTVMGSGDGGDIAIIAQAATNLDAGSIIASTTSGGAAGNVTLSSPSLSLSNGASVASSTSGTGGSGVVTVTLGDALTLGTASIIASSTSGPGNAGRVNVSANAADIRGGSAINSSTSGIGRAGDVSVSVVNALQMGPGSDIAARSVPKPDGQTGAAGSVRVSTGSLTMEDHVGTATAQISSSTQGRGDGGNVTLVIAGPMRMGINSLVTTSANTFSIDANAGAIVLSADSLTLAAGASILSASFSTGNAGSIDVSLAKELELHGGSAIETAARLPTSGHAGTVAIQAGSLLVDGQAFIRSTTASLNPAGTVNIVIAGDAKVNSGFISTSTTGGGSAGDISLSADSTEIGTAGQILSEADVPATGNAGSITLQGNMLTVNGEISTSTSGPGSGGAISLAVAETRIDGGSVTSRADAGSTGDAGVVKIDAPTSLLVTGGGIVSSTTAGAGNGGSIIATVGQMILDGGSLSAQAAAGSTGAAGRIKINADLVALLNGGSISSSTFAAGAAGEIQIDATKISLADTASITSDTESGGSAGDVAIQGGDIMLIGGNISSQARENSTGNAGDVAVTATDHLTNSGTISTATLSSGAAGRVTVAAPTVLLEGSISSDTRGSGTGGAVSVAATSLQAHGTGSISSSAFSSGDAGTVDIDVVNDILLDGDSGFFSRATGSTVPGLTPAQPATSIAALGKAGKIGVHSTTLTLLDSASVSSDTAGKGVGGDITIDVTGLQMNGNASISSAADACFDGSCVTGDAGNVTVQAMDAVLFDSSQISSSTASAGRAGSITLVAGNLKIGGGGAAIGSQALIGSTGAAGRVRVTATDMIVADGALLSTSTAGTGSAGDVTIGTQQLSVSGAGAVTSDSLAPGSGAAGSVVVNGGKIIVLDQGRVSSSTFTGGNAGLVSISASDVGVDHGSIGTSTLGAGDAGTVALTAPNITVQNLGSISSSSSDIAGGHSGSVTVKTTVLQLLSGGSIETVSANPLSAGSVQIAADSIFLSGQNSRVDSENSAQSAGNAGRISVSAAIIRLAEGGAISTNSALGAAGDIDLSLPTNGQLILEGVTRPGTITTSSGPGTGGRITISDPYLILSQGGQILALGAQGGANVFINAQFFIRSADRVNLLSVDGALIVDSQVNDLSSGTRAPDLSFLDASSVLRGQCPIVRARGTVSQFSAHMTGPYGARGASTDPFGAISAIAPVNVEGSC
jgi:filamentous hemagglutinin family protein